MPHVSGQRIDIRRRRKRACATSGHRHASCDPTPRVDMAGWFKLGAERERTRDEVARVFLSLAETGLLPTLPRTAHTALALAREVDTDLDRLCAVVRTDVGGRVHPAARQLRVVARRQTSTTVKGRSRRRPAKTCSIVVAAGARTLYGAAVVRSELWSHALAVGWRRRSWRGSRRAPTRRPPPRACCRHRPHRLLPRRPRSFERCRARAGGRSRPPRSPALRHRPPAAGSVLAEQWNLPAGSPGPSLDHEPARPPATADWRASSPRGRARARPRGGDGTVGGAEPEWWTSASRSRVDGVRRARARRAHLQQTILAA